MTYDSSVLSGSSPIQTSNILTCKKTFKFQSCNVKPVEPERWPHNAYPIIFSSLVKQTYTYTMSSRRIAVVEIE
jgi:hypothetical protein